MNCESVKRSTGVLTSWHSGAYGHPPVMFGIEIGRMRKTHTKLCCNKTVFVCHDQHAVFPTQFTPLVTAKAQQ